LPLSLPFMPRYDDGDSKNPDNISWFKDNQYNDGDSDNPYPFDDSPAYSGVEDSYHPNDNSWFEDNPYNNGDSNNPYHFGDSPASSGVEDGYHPKDISWFKDNPYDDRDSDNPYHFNDSPASSGFKDGGHDHLSVPGFITMHPHQDCANIITTPGRAPSTALRTSSRNSSHQMPPSSDIVLRISPAAGSAIFGYILIAENERHQEKAIFAYFENAGREVTILPCPNFAKFLVDHSLQERNVSLIIDLPRYIIPANIFILQASKYSTLPNKEWLPAPPDLSSFNALSQHSSNRSSLSSRALLSPHDAHGNQRPDPDGVDSSLAHHSFYHPVVVTVVVAVAVAVAVVVVVA
jgi:hypothetical protein